MAYHYGAKSEKRDRERNEDRGWAGTIRLADGETVEAAILADGAGGELHGAEVAELAVGTLKNAIREADSGDLLDDGRLALWCEVWEARLQHDVQERYPGGFSTLAAAIRIRQDVLVFSVGDSPLFLLAEDGVHRIFEPNTRAIEKMRLGMSEDEIPADEFGMLVRAVGAATADGLPLLDRRRFRVDGGGEPQWIVMGSDGVFNYVGGSDLMQIVEREQAGGAPGIAAGLLARSLETGRRQGVYCMDNATVAVLGLNQRLTPKTLPGYVSATARRVLFGRQGLATLCALLLVLMGFLSYWAVRNQPAAPAVPSHVDGYAYLMASNRPKGVRTWAQAHGGWYPQGGAIHVGGFPRPCPISNGVIKVGTQEIDGRSFRFDSTKFSGRLVKNPENVSWATAYWLVPEEGSQDAVDGPAVEPVPQTPPKEAAGKRRPGGKGGKPGKPEPAQDGHEAESPHGGEQTGAATDESATPEAGPAEVPEAGPKDAGPAENVPAADGKPEETAPNPPQEQGQAAAGDGHE